MKSCPQCGKEITEPTSRLVQDSCGHQKCRVCLLDDVEKCEQCSDTKSSSEMLKMIPLDDKSSIQDTKTSVLETKPISVEKRKIKQPKMTVERDLISNLLSNITSNQPSNVTSNLQSNITSNLQSNVTSSNISNDSVIKYKSTHHQSIISLNESKRTYQMLVLPSHITYSDNLYTCKVCKKNFRTKGHVKYHQYCVGGKKPLKCGACSKEFVTKSHLDVHVLTHEDKKPYVCEKCEKTFTTKSKLKRHNLMHSGNKSFVCSACGKSFISKDKLKVHNFVHSKDKPFACKQCKAKFNNSSNLKKHSAVHLKEGIHMCDQCGKRFKLKATLMLHRRVHSNYRSYKCQHCTKAFFNLKDLQRHNLVHSDEKSYSCDECKTSFRRKDNLYRHIRNSHPGKKPAISEKNVVAKPKIVDTPNAINVITSSSSLAKKDIVKAPVINGPIKLAFKTSAFKNTYNIQRNIEPEDNVNIYEKILLPNNTVGRNKDELTMEKSNGERDVYKAFKFKLTKKEKPTYSDPVSFNTTVESSGKIYTELRTVKENCASVIVSANNQNDTFKNVNLN